MKPSNEKVYKDRLKCWIHPGQKIEKDHIWTCCKGTTVTYPGEPTGCTCFSSHDWASDSPLPRGFWDLHPTPTFKSGKTGRTKVPRSAVSLDCEMATNRFDQPELIKMTVIDLFTKEVLIDSLVKPLVKVKHMLTSIHGISYKDIMAASKAGAAINGRDAAREKIFEFVGPETIVLVHGGTNDFTCLRWFHLNIMDTQEVESRIKRIGDDELDDWLDDEGTGLEPICRLRTGVRIRCGSGKHDSLEDAMACRELGVWYASNLRGEVGAEEIAKEEIRIESKGPGLEVSGAVAKLVISTPTEGQAAIQSKPDSTGNELVDIWKCKACQRQMPLLLKRQHCAEKAHIERLSTLVLQKGG
ncbi:hypothetical protein ABW19_dt0209612 [Dactylella cylindrospora]|nr:hypothetical protein ABW19_dt0209612 [Dactylella cylindrospora]